MADDRRAAETVEGRRLRIEGRVQGVGYRAFAYRMAQGIGVSGWVRNLRDGSVEVVAWGRAAELEQLVTALQEGPRWGRVDRILSSPVDEPPPGDGDFAIERDG